MDKLKIDILNWATGADPNDRIQLVKLLLTTATSKKEAVSVMNVARRVRDKLKRDDAGVVRKKSRVEKGAELAPALSESMPVPAPTPEPKAWFKHFKQSSIVALDVEMVHKLIFDEAKKTYINQKSGTVEAGHVAITSFAGETLLDVKVQHAYGSFDTGFWSRKKTGFEKGSLVNGEPLNVVKEKVQSLLQDKLIIVCGGGFKDFSSLYLDPGDFEVFDLHQFFYKYFESSKGKSIFEPIGLRSLVLKYFEVDIQKGVHSALTDALYTMKMFREVYVRMKKVNIEDRFDEKLKHEIFNDVFVLNEKTEKEYYKKR